MSAAATAGGPPPDGAPVPGAGGLRQLLLSQGQPALAGALEEVPGFACLVDLQGEVLEALRAALGVAPARTRHTDSAGLLKLQSLEPGLACDLFRSYRTKPTAPTHSSSSSTSTAAAAAIDPAVATPAAAVAATPSPQLRTMTQIFGRYRTPDGAVRVYTKTTASPPDEWPTPQLDVEIGGTEASLIVYVALAPKASLLADLAYLDHYYLQPPPPLPAAPLLASHSLPQDQAGAPAATNASAASAAGGAAGAGGSQDGGAHGGGGVEPRPPSFRELENEARKQPGFAPFVSPSLWVRAAAVGGLCFSVEWDGGRDPRVVALLRRYVTAVTRIWIAHLLADAANAGGGLPHAHGAGGQRQRQRQRQQQQQQGGPGAQPTAVPAADVSGGWADAGLAAGGELAARRGTDPWVVEQWRRSGVVLRNYVRHDPLTPLLYPVFGEDQVTKWIETVSGEEA
ncbi:hypothetical protein GPECTOR_102g57 [Gonium pectorale]|uniref:Uncharacterized protein n=1 Tax=Gonium pectorale TaxID=33097 RepID=A0A150FZT2_GONPE|nr:hypothetical protein GPECTOR_102g57 [Gonium pectorale]|eukprot:KXZ43104.1 hypothetical protein GPECTOR_102g57 [Gonium pectorale]